MLQQAGAGAGAEGAQAEGESRPNGNSERRADTRELTSERGRLESLIRANVGFADETAAPDLLQNAAAEQAGEVDGDTLQVAEELAQLQTKAAAARAGERGATGSAVSASVNGRHSELHSVGVLRRDAGRGGEMVVTMPPAPIEPMVADRRGLQTMPGLQQDWIRLQDTVGQLPYQLSQQLDHGAPSHGQSKPCLQAELQEGAAS